MNYIYLCPECKEEIQIGVDVAKGQVVNAEVPDSCDVCGKTFDTDDILDCIHDFVSDYLEAHKQPDNRKE